MKFVDVKDSKLQQAFRELLQAGVGKIWTDEEGDEYFEIEGKLFKFTPEGLKRTK